MSTSASRMLVPVVLLLVGVVAAVGLFPRRVNPEAVDVDTPARAPLVTRVKPLPVAFEPNVGQSPSSIAFTAHVRGGTFVFSSTGVRGVVGDGEGAPRELGLSVVGAATVPGVGEARLPGVVNFYVSNDPSRWRTAVPTWSRIVFRAVYPGIDLVWHGENGELEYDFLVEPGADASVIRVASVGAEPLAWSPPTLYQDRADGERVVIAGAFEPLADGTRRFWVGPYDSRRRLVIDPVLSTSTFLGGNANEFISASGGLAVGASGAVYVTGQTASANFPLVNAADPTSGVASFAQDSFVAKLNASGTALEYSTYLGGALNETSGSIAVDASGSARVIGRTNSTDFPTASAYQPARAGGVDVFVTRLDPSGALVFSTYLGGTSDELGLGIALDSSGNAWLVGTTASTNFPLASAIQPTFGGNVTDAFVARLSANGATLQFSTFFGGNDVEQAQSVAVDVSGNAYVTGLTRSSNFPTSSPLQAMKGSSSDAFVTKINAAGTLGWSTFLGGNDIDEGGAIAVDGTGNVWVAGITSSSTFPTASPIQASFGGGLDGFVVKLNPTGSALLASTWLGSTGDERVGAIAVAPGGEPVIVGHTTSFTFPTLNALQTTRLGTQDAFVTRLNAAGTAFVYSTYLGGSGAELGGGVAVDTQGTVHLMGTTTSADLPLRCAAQGTIDGGADIFIIALALDAGTLADGGAPACGSAGGGAAGGNAAGGSAAGGNAAGGNGGGGSAAGGSAAGGNAAGGNAAGGNAAGGNAAGGNAAGGSAAGGNAAGGNAAGGNAAGGNAAGGNAAGGNAAGGNAAGGNAAGGNAAGGNAAGGNAAGGNAAGGNAAGGAAVGGGTGGARAGGSAGGGGGGGGESMPGTGCGCSGGAGQIVFAALLALGFLRRRR